jgi:acetyl-CoA C-acetyltransferase
MQEACVFDAARFPRGRASGSLHEVSPLRLAGPFFAVEKALKRAGMNAGDIDLFERNEAFAAVVLRFMEAKPGTPRVQHEN